MEENSQATAPEGQENAPQDNTPPSLEAQLQHLQDELAKAKDQALRAMAEAENVRRRAQRDVEESSKYAVTGFARDLISVLENLHRAEESIPAEDVQANDRLKNFCDGVVMTRKELASVFERHGITRISPLDQPFDHNFHQAVVQVEDATKPVGTVVQVLQAGYTIKDRLLRPAMVAVSKAPAAAPAPEEAAPKEAADDADAEEKKSKKK